MIKNVYTRRRDMSLTDLVWAGPDERRQRYRTEAESVRFQVQVTVLSLVLRNEEAHEFRLGLFSREDKKMSYVDSESVKTTEHGQDWLTSVLFEKSIWIKTDVKKE